jgi:hypothetical protein
MRALFADLSERARQRNKDIYAYRVNERRQVLALCDAIQVAVANGHHDRANMLLKEMHAIVDPALARRSGVPLRISQKRLTALID